MLSPSRLPTLMLLPALLLACGGDDHDCHDDAGPPAWHADGSRVCYPDPESGRWAMCMLGGRVEGREPGCREGETTYACFSAVGSEFHVTISCTDAASMDLDGTWIINTEPDPGPPPHLQ